MGDNKVGSALITGAAGGMGTAIATAMVEAGYRLVLADRDEDKLQALARKLGPNTFALTLDITDNARVDRLLDIIPEDFRPIDILINNAGHDIGGRKRFDKGAADDWSAIIETNLIGLMRVTRSILPDMVRRDTGDIINMSSVNAIRIIPDMAPYSASKAGVHMLTETIRGELAETGIRVTEINPGLTKTNIIITRYRGDRAQEQKYFDKFKMALDPEDVARAIMFALSQPRHVQIAQVVILPTNRW
jgi:3-hydroxy acid dehydrogenase / malonic semialdehyde reductase